MSDQATPAVDPSTALFDALDTSPPPEGDPPDEVENEAPEGEPEEGSDEPEAEEKPAVEQKFRVKVKNEKDEDEEEDLTLEELAGGYMRNRAFTQKTQAAAAAEKQRQEQFYQAVQHTSQQAQQQLQALHQMVLASAAPELQNVNWQQLAMEDPARYVQLQAKQQQVQSILGHLNAENQKLTQQQQHAIQQQREQAMRHSLDYLSREIPGFNLEKEANNLREMGKKYGYSDDELGSVVDGRFVRLMHDAAQWQKAQAAKPKAMAKVAEAPRVIKPSAPQPKKTNQSALDRLKKSGRASELVHFL